MNDRLWRDVLDHNADFTEPHATDRNRSIERYFFVSQHDVSDLHWVVATCIIKVKGYLRWAFVCN